MSLCKCIINNYLELKTMTRIITSQGDITIEIAAKQAIYCQANKSFCIKLSAII